MSYHSQAQTQQRSIGFMAVVAFHVIAALGLLYGFKIQTIPAPNDSVKINNVVETPQQIDPVVLPTIDLTRVVITQKQMPVVPKISEDTPPPTTTTDGMGITPQATPQLTKPSILKATKPEYPSASTRLGEEGTTTLSLLITENGRVADARIAKSSGYERLDQAAVKHAMRNWVFTPCTQDNKVVSCWHSTNLVWKIENAQR